MSYLDLSYKPVSPTGLELEKWFLSCGAPWSGVQSIFCESAEGPDTQV